MNEDHVREILPLEERAIERGVDISCCTYSRLGTKDAGYCLSEGEDLRFLCQPVNGLVALRKRDNHVAKAKATLLNSLEFFEQGYLPDYRPGLRPLVVVPGGSLVPCSTHITKYPAQNKMAKEFSWTNQRNTCYCGPKSYSEVPFLDQARSIPRYSKRLFARSI